MTTGRKVPEIRILADPDEIRQSIAEEIPFVYPGGVYHLNIVPKTPEWMDVNAFSRMFRDPVMIRGYRSSSVGNGIAWETLCDYRQATVADMLSDSKNLFDPMPDWMYCDYKDGLNFMSPEEANRTFQWHHIDASIDPSINTETMVWIGTKGANTQLHYDTYCSNFIAQLSGTKRWRIFPPNDSTHLYPTRIPFEESSVFSRVNLNDTRSNLDADFPLLQHAHGQDLTLHPGDLFYLPKHWWHFVENLQTSFSINVWVPHPTDPVDRVREATARWLFTTIQGSQQNDSKEWLNPTETPLTVPESLDLLTEALGKKVTPEELIDAVTSPDVLQRIVEQLTIH